MTEQEFHQGVLRRMDRLEEGQRAIDDRLRDAERKSDVTAERYSNIMFNVTSLEQKIDSFQSHVTWLVRLVLGAVILGVVSVISGGGIGG